MSANSDEPLASFYRMLWPENASTDPRLVSVEREVGGRAVEEIFYELASRSGIGRGSIVLDVGCGKGRQACEMMKRLSCRVIAVDPLEHCLRLAHARAEKEGIAEHIEFRRAGAEKLPVGNGEVDLIWCLDTFNHAGDIGRSFREFARALKPEGIIFNCSALETPSLEPREKEWLCRTLSLNPETLSQRNMEESLASCGLRILSAGSTIDVGSRFFERIDDKDFLCIQRLARMTRDERRFVDALGERDYQILKAHALWNAYWLIGKITYHVWVIGPDS